MIKSLILFCFMLLANTQTNIGGELSGNIIWNAEGSPYVIIAPTLLKGATVMFSKFRMRLMKDSTITSTGNSTHRVKINISDRVDVAVFEIYEECGDLSYSYTDIKSSDTLITTMHNARHPIKIPNLKFFHSNVEIDYLLSGNSEYLEFRSTRVQGFSILSDSSSDKILADNSTFKLSHHRFHNGKIDKCRFIGSGRDHQEFSGKNSEITNSIFESFEYVFMFGGLEGSTIRNSIFRYNRKIMRFTGFDDFPSSVFQKNTFEKNGGSVSSLFSTQDSKGVTNIHYNNFINTAGLVVSVTEQKFNLSYNYWGTTDEEEIKKKIEIKGFGYVIYKPFLTERIETNSNK